MTEVTETERLLGTCDPIGHHVAEASTAAHLDHDPFTFQLHSGFTCHLE